MSDTQEASKTEVPFAFDEKYVDHYNKVLPRYNGVLSSAMELKLAELRKKATQLIRRALKILEVGSGFDDLYGLTYRQNSLLDTKAKSCMLELSDRDQHPTEPDHPWLIHVLDGSPLTACPTKLIVFRNDLGEPARLISSSASPTDAEIKDARFDPLQTYVSTLHDLVAYQSRIHSAEKAVKLAESVINAFTKRLNQVLDNDLANELEKYGIPGYDFWNHSS